MGIALGIGPLTMHSFHYVIASRYFPLYFLLNIMIRIKANQRLMNGAYIELQRHMFFVHSQHVPPKNCNNDHAF